MATHGCAAGVTVVVVILLLGVPPVDGTLDVELWIVVGGDVLSDILEADVAGAEGGVAVPPFAALSPRLGQGRQLGVVALDAAEKRLDLQANQE